MSTVVLTSRAPTSPTSGYDLRVAHLCAHTPGPLHLAVVRLEPDDAPDRPASGSAVEGFASTTWVDDLLVPPSGLRRHLRRSDAAYLRTSRPDGLAAARRRVDALADEVGAARVVVFGGDLVEVLGPAGASRRTVLDVCDSVALTRRRQQEAAGSPGLAERLRGRVALARSRALEARLPDRVDVLVTISEQDSAEVRRLGHVSRWRGLLRAARRAASLRSRQSAANPGPPPSSALRDEAPDAARDGPDIERHARAGGRAEVHTVPNGVDERFLAPLPPPGGARAVGFWGNLVFGPNQDSLRFFLREVHAPLLRPAGVRVVVIGPNAPDWLLAHAADDPLVELVGFVPDLAEALADVPVAINAMRTGSGLKNKVLEAFGMGLVVVTTTRGIEAVAGAQDGEHVVVADTAEDLGAAVLRVLDDPTGRDRLRARARTLLETDYRWGSVGERWRALVS